MSDIVKTIVYIVIALWLWGKFKGAPQMNTNPYNSGYGRYG